MNSIEIWNDLGNLYIKGNAVDAAIDAYRKAIDQGYQTSELYKNLAGAYVSQGNIRESIASYEKSLEMSDDQKEKALVYTYLGDCYRRMGDIDKAIASFKAAIEIEPGNPELCVGLNAVQQDLEMMYGFTVTGVEPTRVESPEMAEPEPAIRPELSILGMEKKDETLNEENGWVEVAEMREQSDVLLETQEMAGTTAETNIPDIKDVEMHTAIDEIVERDEQIGEMAFADLVGEMEVSHGVDFISVFAAEKPELIDDEEESPLENEVSREKAEGVRVTLLLTLGVMHWRNGNLEEAGEILQSAISAAIKIHNSWFEALAWHALALVKTAKADIKGAIQAYLRAVELAPEQILPWNNLGSLYGSLGENDEALSAYQKAIRNNPEDSTSWDGLGDIFTRQGRLDDAIAAYQLGNVFENQPRGADAATAYRKAFDFYQMTLSSLDEQSSTISESPTETSGFGMDGFAVEEMHAEDEPVNNVSDIQAENNRQENIHQSGQPEIFVPGGEPELGEEVIASNIGARDAVEQIEQAIAIGDAWVDQDLSTLDITDSEMEMLSEPEPDPSEEDEEWILSIESGQPAIDDMPHHSGDELETFLEKVTTELQEIGMSNSTLFADSQQDAIHDPDNGNNIPEMVVDNAEEIAPTVEFDFEELTCEQAQQLTEESMAVGFVLENSGDASLELDEMQIDPNAGDISAKNSNLSEMLEPVVEPHAVNSATFEEAVGEQPSSYQVEMPQAEASANASEPELPPVVTIDPAPRSDVEKLAGTIISYEAVVKQNPKNDRAWDSLGNLYRITQRNGDAIMAFEQAVALEPANYVYHYQLGSLYAAEGNFDAGIREIRRVVELNPGFIFAHCALASYLRKLGQEEAAQEHIAIALPYMSNEKEYDRACFESIRGNTETALNLLTVALEKKQTTIEWIRRDLDLDFIRNDPRYKLLEIRFSRSVVEY
jgi:tetratricopeptide (TPR) repeat protein